MSLVWRTVARAESFRDNCCNIAISPTIQTWVNAA